MKTGKNRLVRGMALFMSGILFFGPMPGTVTASEVPSDSVETSEVFIEPEVYNSQAPEYDTNGETWNVSDGSDTETAMFHSENAAAGEEAVFSEDGQSAETEEEDFVFSENEQSEEAGDQGALPEGGQPEEAAPESEFPEGQPEEAAPESEFPEGQPEEAAPESEFPQGQPEEAAPESKFPEGQPEEADPGSAFDETGYPEGADGDQAFSEIGQSEDELGQSEENGDAEAAFRAVDPALDQEEAASVPAGEWPVLTDDQSVTEAAEAAEAAGNSGDDAGNVIAVDPQTEETASEEAAGTVSGNWTYTLKENGLTIDKYTGSETEVVIPDTIDGYKVSNIGRKAFYNNHTMRSVTIPVGITSIGAEAFWGCIALNTINYNARNCTFPSVWIYDDARGVGVFSGAGSASTSLTVVFGSGIASVPANMFHTASIGEYGVKGYDYAHITSIVFSDSIREIGSNAFRNCDDLGSVELGSRITTVGSNAFNDCDSIVNLDLDDNLQTIQEGAFGSCNSLETIHWGSSLDTIDKSAFEGCINLLEADIPSPVRTIGIRAFADCQSLTRVILPASLNSLKGEAFMGTLKLSSLTVNSKNLTPATPWIHDNARGAGVFSGAGAGVTSMEVVFGNGVTNVPANLFYTASIGEYGLKGYDFAHVTSVRFSNTVETIGENAFRNCDDLAAVTLGTGLTEIGTRAFCDCDNITSITMSPALHTIGEAAFNSCDGLEAIHWSTGLDEIGTSAFESCTSLKEVQLPSPLRVIGPKAFKGCTAMTAASLPASLNELRGEAFAETTRLSELIIKAPNMNVASPWIYDGARGAGVFSGAGAGASALDVKFASAIKKIPANMFFTASTTEYGIKGEDYAHITSVTFNAAVQEIGTNAFRTTNDLKHVYYPGNQEKWKLKTTILEGNEGLEGATVHFGSQLRHDLISVNAVKATLTKDGNIRHYKCKDCGNHFSDSRGTTKIAKANYTIPAAKNISLSATSLTYTGAVRKPTVKVLDRNKKTIAKANYTITWSNTSSKKAGTYYATVKLTGTRYAGSKKLTYKITPAPIGKAKVTGIKTKVYTGKALTQNPVVKIGTTLLKKGTDYTLSYKNNKNVGTATVTITGKGNYKGTIRKTWKINPGPTAISALTPASGAFTAAWKKQAVQTTGYKIQYSTDKTFKTGVSAKTAAGASTVRKQITGLTKGRTYYVRICTYKTIGSTNYVSTWSPAKSVKVR